MKKNHPKSVGGQLAVSSDIETILASAVDQVAAWGFPLDRGEVKIIVKSILDDQKAHSFKNNMPGDDWINGFLKRNKMVRNSS